VIYFGDVQLLFGVEAENDDGPHRHHQRRLRSLNLQRKEMKKDRDRDFEEFVRGDDDEIGSNGDTIERKIVWISKMMVMVMMMMTMMMTFVFFVHQVLRFVNQGVGIFQKSEVNDDQRDQLRLKNGYFEVWTLTFCLI
jgi:zona occludens toxin (predicted ATPase)